MKKTPVLLTAAGLAAAAAASAAVASGHARAPTAHPAHAQQLALVVRSAGHGGEQVSPSGGNIAIAPGVPVRVTITNYTHMYHTFTVPGLHVGVMVTPGRANAPSKTTFTFTAWESGTFKWFCAFCDHGGPGHRDHMGGSVYAVIDPSSLP